MGRNRRAPLRHVDRLEPDVVQLVRELEGRVLFAMDDEHKVSGIGRLDVRRVRRFGCVDPPLEPELDESWQGLSLTVT